MSFSEAKSIAIMGATATGKSKLAIHLAERFGGQIVSMDSRQVYRGMDVGTAKVPHSERRGIPHYLIDILDPDEPNSAGVHATRAEAAICTISEQGALPILVGGTGLYLRALFYGLAELGLSGESLVHVRRELSRRKTPDLYEELRREDPKRAAEISPNDRIRITRALEVRMLTGKPISQHFAEQKRPTPWKGLKIVLTLPRAELRRRIALRTRHMFDTGWVDEVERLLGRGYAADAPGMKSLGYREIAEAITKGRDPFTTIDRVITITGQYAKRQETFFRAERDAQWHDVIERGSLDRIEAAVSRYLSP